MPHAKPGSENTKRIILFNGPPGCGKDTAAKIINLHIPNLVYQYKMALPLKEACHKLLGLQGSLEDLEPLKEVPIKFLVQDSYNLFPNQPKEKLVNANGEMTLRQFYIHISENVMKPMFGIDIFGKLAVENLRQCHQAVATVSDTGFVDEALPIIDYFGPDHVMLVRLHRPGKTFAGDSRGYVELPVNLTLDIHNDTDIETFEKTLWRKIHNNFLIGMF